MFPDFRPLHRSLPKSRIGFNGGAPPAVRARSALTFDTQDCPFVDFGRGLYPSDRNSESPNLKRWFNSFALLE